MKEEVLTKAEGTPLGGSRYKPKPSLLEFLNNL